MKAKYSAFLVDKEKLGKVLNNRQEEIDEEMERKRFEAKQEQQREEERRLTDTNQIARASSAEIQATMSGYTTWTFWGSETEVRMTSLMSTRSSKRT